MRGFSAELDMLLVTLAPGGLRGLADPASVPPGHQEPASLQHGQLQAGMGEGREGEEVPKAPHLGAGRVYGNGTAGTTGCAFDDLFATQGDLI